MADSKSVPGVGPLLRLGEEKLTQLLTQLLSNETFVASLQAAISSAMKAKGTMDRSLVGLLSTFNVPTLEDVSLMRTKLAELEDAVADLGRVVDRLEKRGPAKRAGGSARS